MKSQVAKRSIVIANHKTSVSLEDAFWNGLKEIAGEQKIPLASLVEKIDNERIESGKGNLSSSIRLFVLDHYRAKCTKQQQEREQDLPLHLRSRDELPANPTRNRRSKSAQPAAN